MELLSAELTRSGECPGRPAGIFVLLQGQFRLFIVAFLTMIFLYSSAQDSPWQKLMEADRVDNRFVQAYNWMDGPVADADAINRLLFDLSRDSSFAGDYRNVSEELVSLGFVFLKRDEPDAAVLWFNRAGMIDSSNMSVYIRLGGACITKGDSVIHYLYKAYTDRPGHPGLLYLISSEYYCHGDCPNAKRIWAECGDACREIAPEYYPRELRKSCRRKGAPFRILGVREYQKEKSQMNKGDVLACMRSRNFEATHVETRQDTLALLLTAISPGSRVAWGGSVTLNEVGINEALILRDDIVVLNRDAATSVEEKHRIQIETFGSDFCLMGKNALTADGKLVNIDGMGNRLAALIYRPRVVYVVAGINEICATEQEALARVGQMAAPANVRRLGRDTPCAISGHCHDCLSDDRVCSHIVITRRSWVPGRIRVILVDEVFRI